MKDWQLANNKKTILITIISLLIVLGLFFFLKNNQRNDESEPIGYSETKISEIPFDMPPINIPEFPDNICNVKDYGAVGNGIFVNTELIKKAIDDCSRKGGGKIIFPEGKWLTGPIHFKSNINIHLDENSEIVFTSNLDDYLPVVFSKFQGMEYYNFSPPIYAKDCENIALTGKGKISGNGSFWDDWARTDNSEIQREKLFKMSQTNIPIEERVWGTKDSGLRPSFIQFVSCKNILIEDLMISNGPMWTIHPIYSENITIRNVSINTHSMNTDGIAIESSKNVSIENSNFSTGDDAIAIKSGLEDEGLRINRPSENIVIRNSHFSFGHGAIAIGSEMSGGVRNVFIADSTFNSTNSGIRIKSAKSRGGFIENIWVENIKMENFTDEAIVFNLKYKTALKTSKISREPALKNIHFRNITGKSVNKVLSILGLPDGKMENISFENLDFQSENSSDVDYAKNIEFKNILLKTNSPDPSFLIKDSQNIKLFNFKCASTNSSCLAIKGTQTSNIDLGKSDVKRNSILVGDELRKQIRFNGFFDNIFKFLNY